MDFMGFHIVDIVIVALVLFLAIKGLINGFSKELLNFLIVVGGIFTAARYNSTVVQLINEQEIAPAIPEAYAKIIGFVIIIVVIWLLLGVVSSIVNKLTSDTTGIFSRILGYILSFARYVAIFSLIVFGVNQSDFFKDEANKLNNDTKLFVPMAEIGATLLNIDMNATTTANISIENNSTATDLELNASNENNLSLSSATTLTEHNTSN